MNKKVFSFFLIIIALIVGAFYYTDVVQRPLITTLNILKSKYHDSLSFIQMSANKYFFQVQEIERLHSKLQKYENNHLVMRQLATEINDLYTENDSNFTLNPKVQLVQTISYQEFGNFNRLWLNIEEYNSSKIYGLTYNELVAGIVINKNNSPLALLNKDPKTSYTVTIGSNSAPGIAHGNNSKNIIIKYIPSWFNIKKGDEVVTSGLDNIFFKGLKVGQVISTKKSQGYQNAIVKPYYMATDPNYFYMIRSIR